MFFFSDIKPGRFSNRQTALCHRYKKLALEFHQPELEKTPYRLREVVEDVKARLFPELTPTPQCIFCKDKTLAFITTSAELIRIQISPLLNTPETPRQVIEHIVIHELLHMVIRPREIDGKKISHPPEFWEREKVLSPDAKVAWSWIYGNVPIKVDEERERTYVDLIAQKRGITPWMTWEEAREDEERWDKMINPCAPSAR